MWEGVESGVERNTKETRTNNTSLVHIWIWQHFGTHMGCHLISTSPCWFIFDINYYSQNLFARHNVHTNNMATTCQDFWVHFGGDVLSWKQQNVEHPSEDLAKSGYKPEIKYKFSIILSIYLATQWKTTNTNLTNLLLFSPTLLVTENIWKSLFLIINYFLIIIFNFPFWR
jgi:hypothetical protein